MLLGLPCVAILSYPSAQSTEVQHAGSGTLQGSRVSSSGARPPTRGAAVHLGAACVRTRLASSPLGDRAPAITAVAAIVKAQSSYLRFQFHPAIMLHAAIALRLLHPAVVPRRLLVLSGRASGVVELSGVPSGPSERRRRRPETRI